MNRLFAALLAAILVSTPVPSYDRGSQELGAGNGAASSSRSHALRATESAETGLEEQLRQALNAGLEEGIQIKTAADLRRLGDEGDSNAAELAGQLGDKAGVALLPVERVAAWELTDKASPQVVIYAHPSVAEWIPYWLPSGWGLSKSTQLFKKTAAEANLQLAEAAETVAEGQTVIVAVDKTMKAGLQLPGAVVILLDPETIDGIHSGTIAAFLSQARDLTHLILDLTSGSIRTVTIGNTEYYALDIAA